MRPMIYYLNQYKDGAKIAPAGFLKLQKENEHVQVELHLQMDKNVNENGTCFFYIEESGWISMGEIKIIRGEGVATFQTAQERVKGVGNKIGENWVVSCFDEKWKEAMLYPFEPEEEETIEPEPQKEEVQELPQMEVAKEVQKIEFAQIRDLPASNWHLSTNHFLIHGYINYHYLVLIEKEDGRYLGVPGLYEVPESMMAVMFGFPEFEKASSEDDAEKPFGYWCCKLV